MRLLLGLGAALLALGVAGAQDVRAGCSPSLAPRDGLPRWSPDSRQIAFVRRGIGCSPRSAVFIVGRDGGVRFFANGGSLEPPSPPAWSPDGTRIALSSGGRLVVMNGRGLDELAAGGLAPAWSPDGRRIAFRRGDELRIVDVDGSNERLVARGLSDFAVPLWSSDGLELVYGGADGDIHVVAPDTGVDRVLAPSPATDFDPAWAGTAGALYFVSDRDGSAQIWSVSRDGSRVRQETRGPDSSGSPATTPDGFTVAFVRLGSNEPGLHLWPPESQRHFRVSRSSYVLGPPALSPDGKLVAFGAPGRCGRFGIHVVPVDLARGERRLTSQCVFRGGPGRDLLRGTDSRDFLFGGDGDDVLEARRGPDVVVAGRGRDRLSGGDGADLLLARDGWRDAVSCGPARDEVVADRLDVVARDCEVVWR